MLDMQLARRRFLTQTSAGLGAAAVTGLLNPRLFADSNVSDTGSRGALTNLHFPAKAKRVIYLFQSGGPAQMELFDYKPHLRERHGTELPDSVRRGQRLFELQKHLKE